MRQASVLALSSLASAIVANVSTGRNIEYFGKFEYVGVFWSAIFLFAATMQLHWARQHQRDVDAEQVRQVMES
jgi:hypothetical protein